MLFCFATIEAHRENDSAYQSPFAASRAPAVAWMHLDPVNVRRWRPWKGRWPIQAGRAWRRGFTSDDDASETDKNGCVTGLAHLLERRPAMEKVPLGVKMGGGGQCRSQAIMGGSPRRRASWTVDPYRLIHRARDANNGPRISNGARAAGGTDGKDHWRVGEGTGTVGGMGFPGGGAAGGCQRQGTMAVAASASSQCL